MTESVTEQVGSWIRSPSVSTAVKLLAKNMYFRVIAGLMTTKTMAELRGNSSSPVMIAIAVVRCATFTNNEFFFSLFVPIESALNKSYCNLTLHTPVTKQNYLHRMLFLDMY